jgi:SAM-dependent methyltransferase
VKLEELKKDWDALGRIDPMWAVLTHEDRRNRGWDAESFLANGREEIAGVMRDLERLGRPARRGRCLDFGCGVGRLTQALAEHFERSDGVDIAPSMLEEARKLNRHGARCVFHLNDTDDLGLFENGTFDFVYSNIVLQHVGPAAAKAYIREFLRVLVPTGVVMFQLPSENIRQELLRRFKLPPDACRAEITARLPASVTRGERFTVLATVTNTSSTTWRADLPTDGAGRIRLGNHWFGAGGDVVAVDDGRTDLPRNLEPGGRVEIPLAVTAPASPGSYRLELDLVQEGLPFAWFAQKGSRPLSATVEVRDAPEAAEGTAEGTAPSPRPYVVDARDDRLTLVAGDSAPTMRMHAIPRDEVVEFLEDAGANILEVREDASAGREWRSYRYTVAPILPAMSARVPDDAWVSARVEKARHEREMALAVAKRLEEEVRRLEYRVAELEADRVALKNRTEEAEAYVAAVKKSTPWRIVQALRALVGRQW